MSQVVLGVFKTKATAENALANLQEAGFNPKDISIITKDTSVREEIIEESGTNAADATVSGAATGGVLGGLAGLLVGIGAITIPGIGALLIAGPIAAALGLTGAAATTVSGALTGALAGGVVGALVGLGVPEEDARVYEDEINKGAILVAVPATDSNQDDARAILEENEADQIRTVAAKF